MKRKAIERRYQSVAFNLISFVLEAAASERRANPQSHWCCNEATRERSPGSIVSYATGVSERGQQSCGIKDAGDFNNPVRERPALHALMGLSFVPFLHPMPKLQG